MKHITGAFMLLMLLAGEVSAAGESGMQFLGITPDARGNSMAGAVIAEVTTLDSLVWNPAGLAKMSQRNASFTYTKWIGDMNHVYLAYGMPVIDPQFGKFGVSAVFFSQGSLSQTTGGIQDMAGLDSYDLALSGGYGIAFESLQVGGALRFITSKIIGVARSGVALDLGGQYALDEEKNYKVGLVVKNAGLNSSLEAPPMEIQAGFAYRYLLTDDFLRADLSADYLVSDRAGDLRLGLEYGFRRILFARAGYRIDPSGFSLGAIHGFTFGLGGNLVPPFELVKLIIADVTWIPMGELGNSMQITCGLKF